MAIRATQFYLVSDDGKIRFTSRARKEWSGLFSMAGIAIGSIKTYDEYIQARRKASPYFLDYLDNKVAAMPDTGEYALLKSLTFDSDEVYEEKLRQHNLKKNLKVVKKEGD